MKPCNESPAIFGALGLALAFYGFSPLTKTGLVPFMAAPLVFFVVISFFRVLVSLPPALRGEVSHPRRAFGLRFSSRFIAFASGFCLGLSAVRALPPPPRFGLGENHKITALSGLLESDPRRLNGGRGMASLALRAASAEGGIRASASGSVPVFFPAELVPALMEAGRGGEVYIEGKPVNGERGILFRAVSLHVTKPTPGPEKFRGFLRERLLEKISGGAGEVPVWGGLAAALLLGVRDDLDAVLASGFREAGCSHVLALSGMHLALLSAVIAFFLKKPLGLKAASLLGGLFIVFYVWIAGPQPSLVRSLIMYLLSALGLWFSLRGGTGIFLALAFIIQICSEPASGMSLSFILSYLALGGILWLGEDIHEILRGKLPEFFAGTLSASLGAFIASAPVTALYFGTLRPVGIAAGLVVVPLASLFMIVSLGALVLHGLAPGLFFLSDLVLTPLYRSLEFLVGLSAQVPGISSLSPLTALSLSLGLWLFFALFSRKYVAQRNSFAGFD